MAHCPFCDNAIDQTLSDHGGTCPSCFGHIPGEETATDPGEEARAAIAAADARQAQRRARMPLLVAVPVVLAAVGAAAWSLVGEPEVETLVFDADDGFAVEIDLAAWHEPEPEPEDAPVARSSAPRASSPSRDAAPASKAGSASDGSVAGTAASAAPSGSADDLDLAFQARRTAATLEGRADIQAAVKDMLKARVPRLQQCFERHLKSNDALNGSWTLSFTIGTDGVVSGPSATGQQMSDAAFEACLVDEMQAWAIYGRLAKPWPVSLPVSFRGRS